MFRTFLFSGPRALLVFALAAAFLLAACGTDTATPTAIPTIAPADTGAAATATVVPATDTPLVATETPVPPTAVPAPDTAVPPTAVPPSETPLPPTSAPATNTAAAPTATAVPPTAKPAPPTARPIPPTAKPVPPTPRPAPPTAKPTAKPTAPPAAKVVYVREIDFAFDPPTITVDRGTKVIWTNIGPTDHTVADDNVTWSSEILHKNDVYSHTFTASGTVTVICTLHPDMVSKVIVR